VWPVRGGGRVSVAKLVVRDVAQLTMRYVVGGGDRTGGYARGVVEGLRGRRDGEKGGDDAAGLPVAAPTAAAATPLRPRPLLR